MQEPIQNRSQDHQFMSTIAPAPHAGGRLRREVRGVNLTAMTLIAGLFLLLAGRPVTAQIAPGGCRELVVNGGFEAATLAPWQESSAAGFPLLDSFFVHSGSQSVWLGGYTNASDYLTQTLTLPAGATQAALQLWVQIDTTEANNAAALDIFTVEIKDAAGNLLGTVASLSNQDHSAAWSLRTYNVLAYAGQTVQLVLHGAGSVDNNITDFHVDDISLAVCAADLKVFMPWVRK